MPCPARGDSRRARSSDARRSGELRPRSRARLSVAPSSRTKALSWPARLASFGPLSFGRATPARGSDRRRADRPRPAGRLANREHERPRRLCPEAVGNLKREPEHARTPWRSRQHSCVGVECDTARQAPRSERPAPRVDAAGCARPCSIRLPGPCGRDVLLRDRQPARQDQANRVDACAAGDPETGVAVLEVMSDELARQQRAFERELRDHIGGCRSRLAERATATALGGTAPRPPHAISTRSSPPRRPLARSALAGSRRRGAHRPPSCDGSPRSRRRPGARRPGRR